MNTSDEFNPETSNNQARTLANIDWLANLPNLLRILGTGVLLIAMYSFLVKGWQSGNDVFRYLMMLGHTGALAAIGLASGHWLKENKGARLLLTLALVSVPANFAILGALIFSQTTPIELQHYPSYVAWTADTLSTALVTTGGALLVLIPVTLLGFAVLARRMSKNLTLLFLVSNAILLLPLRDPHLIGTLVLILATCVIVFTRKTSREHLAAKTQDGLTALALQFLPLAVLMGRSLWLYSFDLFVMTTLAITSFFILRQASAYLKLESKWRNVCDGLSLLPALAVIPLLASALYDMLLIPVWLSIPVAALVSAALIYDISCRNPLHAALYRNTAAGVLLVSFTGNLIMFQGLIPAILCMAAGLSLMTLGYQQKQRGIFSSGILLMLIGLGHQLYKLVHHFDLGSWIGLAMLGVVAIVLASTIESQGGKFKTQLAQWKLKFKQWER